MIDNSKEYILCAAIKRKRPKKCHRCYYPQLSDIFEIEIGYRHPDIMYRFFKEVEPYSDGFYTSKGRFVDRKEAAKIAYECGQTKELKNQLFSEDIY